MGGNREVAAKAGMITAKLGAMSAKIGVITTKMGVIRDIRHLTTFWGGKSAVLPKRRYRTLRVPLIMFTLRDAVVVGKWPARWQH